MDSRSLIGVGDKLRENDGLRRGDDSDNHGGIVPTPMQHVGTGWQEISSIM